MLRIAYGEVRVILFPLLSFIDRDRCSKTKLILVSQFKFYNVNRFSRRQMLFFLKTRSSNFVVTHFQVTV